MPAGIPRHAGLKLADIVEGHGLGTDAAAQLDLLLKLIVEDDLAPTTVRDPQRVVEDHLADSLVALDVPEVQAAASVADLGSGAGIPGLPLAIALPGASVTMVESVGRKCEFIARAISACGLRNAAVVNGRAEDWPEGIRRFDVVTARALAALDVVAEYAAPLLRIGGALVAWRGRRDAEAEVAAARAAEILGLQFREPVPVIPYAGAEHRHLHVAVKVMETPARFPRRAGMARKRPLGGGRPQPVPATDATASDRERR